MFRRFFTASVCVLTLLSGCSLGVYKVPVQQGNLVTPVMLEKLKPGMTKSQVQFIMGEPLVPELTQENQWLYLYEKEKGVKNVKGYRVRIYFDKQGLYSHHEGQPDKTKRPNRF